MVRFHLPVPLRYNAFKAMMKKCPKCCVKHNKKGMFCSRSCANSRYFSHETRKRKSIIARKIIDNKPKRTMTLTARSKLKDTLYQKSLQKFLRGDVKDKTVCKKWLKILNKEECAKCKLPAVWQNQYLSLQIDHIDGNAKNNMPSNLRLLCPNCHSQTDTYAGKKHRKPDYASSEAVGLSNQ